MSLLPVRHLADTGVKEFGKKRLEGKAQNWFRSWYLSAVGGQACDDATHRSIAAQQLGPQDGALRSGDHSSYTWGLPVSNLHKQHTGRLRSSLVHQSAAPPSPEGPQEPQTQQHL